MPDRSPAVAVIGSGIGGLTCAGELQQAGFDARVFDKGRGVGGRMAARRADHGARFDHGAQYFTADDADFAQHVQKWADAGVVAAWDGRVGRVRAGEWTADESTTPRYVGVPGMSALPKHLAQGLNVQQACRVTRLDRETNRWRLTGEEQQTLGEFDVVVLNAPPAQASELIGEASPIAGPMRAATMNPCWAVMLAFSSRLDLPWDAAKVEDTSLAWVARDSSKPERPREPDCWVVHATADWTTRHLEDSREDVLTELMNDFWSVTGAERQTPLLATAHRWRYALATESRAERHLFDAEQQLGACGDWYSGPRIEDAWLSGRALASAIVRHREGSPE